jgi:hypothetical protein
VLRRRSSLEFDPLEKCVQSSSRYRNPWLGHPTS